MKQTISLKIPAILSVALAASTLHTRAAILTAPSVTGFSSEFDARFAASNVFDGGLAEYASAGDGLATFLEFTFAAPTTFDRIVVVNRNGGGPDLVADFTLTLDGGAGGTRSVVQSNVAALQGAINVLGTTTATTVRLDVDSVSDGGVGLNVGATEIFFLNTPAGASLITGVSVINASAPGNGDLIGSNAVDGIIGFGGGGTNNGDFASAGQGAFLEFDLGSLQEVGSFDFFDRLNTADQNTSFNLTFSEDNIFGNADDTIQSYTGSTQSAEFAGINARYIRYDNTGVVAGGNAGVAEFQFYTAPIPEPSSAALVGLAGITLLLRRRR